MRFTSLASVVLGMTLSSTATFAADFKPYVGTWKTTVPKSVTNKASDMTLTVTFDAKGQGFPKFVNADGDTVFFAGAVTADLFEEGGKMKTVILREWVVTLSKDQKTMTWTEVKGTDKLEFTKQ